MPTITRFLTIVVTLFALVAAVTLALAYLVTPDTRPMTAPVDPAALARAIRTDSPPPEPAATTEGDAADTDAPDAPDEGAAP